jgi:hypothetical protein
MEEGAEYVVSGRRFRDRDTAETYALLLLAFLDTMGYAQRSQRRPPIEQFQGVLELGRPNPQICFAGFLDPLRLV